MKKSILFLFVFFTVFNTTVNLAQENTVLVVRALNNANIRAEPSTQSEITGQAVVGDIFRLISEVPDGQLVDRSPLWYEIGHNGQSAYIWSGVAELTEHTMSVAATEMMPARYYYSAVWDSNNEQMLLFGGSDVRGRNELYTYNPTNNQWSQIITNAAPNREAPNAAFDTVTNSMYVFGGAGTDVGYSVSNELWRFDAGLNMWQLVSPSGALPRNRSLFAMAIAPERREIIVFGGQWGNADQILNDTWIYLIDENRWEQRFPNSEVPSPRQGHSGVWDSVNQRFLVFGGWDSLNPMKQELWSYDPEENQWQLLSPTGTLPSGRFRHAAVWDTANNEMLIFGGCCSPSMFYNDVWSYSPQTNSWRLHELSTNPPRVRQRIDAVWDTANEQMIVYGGLGECDMLNDTWAYSPTTGVWSLRSIAETPLVARQGHTATYDENTRDVLLYGGCDGSNIYTDLWQYAIDDNTWNELSANSENNAIPPRTAHLTVWDDNNRHMYVIGGTNSHYPYGVLDDMWRFDNQDNTWENISPNGDFPRRYDSSAVWDSFNQQILVYGGTLPENSAREQFSDDFRSYNPITNTWMQIQPNGQYPGGLTQHRAIWDPIRNRMLVWGGFTFSSGQFVKIYNEQLWAYDPQDNSWSRLANTGDQPSALLSFAWVWDTNNDHLLLFGGDRKHEPRTNDDPLLYDELWRYDSITDQWTLLAHGEETPTARTRHQMIFDAENNSIVMFGGYGYQGYLNEIWHYDIATNTWEQITSPNLASVPLPETIVHQYVNMTSENARPTSLDGFGTITGHILDVNNQFIPHIDVTLWRETDGIHILEICSDDSGNYVFENVAPGRYKIAVGLHENCSAHANQIRMSNAIIVDEINANFDGIDVIIPVQRE